MTGKPGLSGGRRDGAGRPVSTCKLKSGQFIAIHEHTPDGFMPGRGATVEIVKRGTIVLHCDDGAEIILTLGSVS